MHGMQHSSQLAGIDVGLVVPLAALLEEKNVTRAARRVGLSPSATSHALGRLRIVIGDPLLVRAGRSLVRTPRGEELLDPARRAVAELESVFRPPAKLDPSTLRAAFRIATTDHGQLVVLGEVDRLLSREAPLVDLYAVPHDRGSYAAMRDGQADVAISVFRDVPPDFGHVALWEDELVAVVRAGHPLARGRVTERRFVAFDHALVTPLGTTPRGPIDEALAARGLSRRVARTFPTFVDAAHFVAESDYVMALPATVVRRVARVLQLRPIRAPVPMLRYTMTMIWQRRLDADPAHAWLRSILVRAARAPNHFR